MNEDPRAAWYGKARALVPGLLVCLTVAMAAGFMSQQYGGPQVLYALLIGLALHTVGSEGALADGVNNSIERADRNNKRRYIRNPGSLLELYCLVRKPLEVRTGPTSNA